MAPARRSRRRLGLEGWAILVLLLAASGLLGWLSTRHHAQLDWTSASRNTLAEASRRVLDAVDGEIRITAYAREDLVRRSVHELVERYRRHRDAIALEVVDPDRAPERARRAGVRTDGELVVAVGPRTEHVRELSERALTSALARLARGAERWVVYLSGHGERDLLGRANHDLGDFGAQLEQRGFRVQPLRLAESGQVPDNADVLVLSRGEAELLPGEVEAVQRWIAGGGNLLWLGDPGPARGLETIAEGLGIRFRPGVVVDPSARMIGIRDPAFVVVGRYGSHPITDGFDLVTVFPHAAGLERAGASERWTPTPVLESAARSWVETGSLAGEVRFDPGRDRQGPVPLGLALTRPAPGADAPAAPQRVAVLGDGDFLANAYLGNGGNLDLGLRLVRWLVAQDRLVEVPARVAPDADFHLSGPASIVIGLGSLVVLPGVLLGAGALVWARRRRR